MAMLTSAELRRVNLIQVASGYVATEKHLKRTVVKLTAPTDPLGGSAGSRKRHRGAA